jgi:hypothetical protein
MSELASYRCHKVVKAGEIKQIDAIYPREGGAAAAPSSFRVHVRAGDAHAGVVIKDVPYGTFARLISETGGTIEALGQMLVVYDEGFVSWSPRDAFEAGYTLLGEEDAGGRYIGLHRGEEPQS